MSHMNGGAKRGSKKVSKGKKSQRGGDDAKAQAVYDQCTAFYNSVEGKKLIPPNGNIEKLIVRCFKNANEEEYESRTKMLLRAKEWAKEVCQEVPPMKRGICLQDANNLKGGKRRGSKKASKKGSKKGGAKKGGAKKGSKKGSKKGKKY